MNTALTAAPTLATSVAARISTTTLDAQQVIYQLWIFLAVLFSGLSVPAQSITGTLLGEGDPQEAQRYARRMLWLGTWLGVFVGGIVAIAAPFIPRIFTANPAVIHEATEGLFIAAALQVPSEDLTLRTDELIHFLSSISSASPTTLTSWFAQFHSLARLTETTDNALRKDIGLPASNSYPT